MELATTRFGSVKIDEEQIVTFPEGIPGFEEAHCFVFLPHPGGQLVSPFRWMQSIDQPALAFPVISPWQICSEYAPTVPGSALRELAISDIRKQAQIWAIVTIPRDNPQAATVNLLAPVLINTETNNARQVLLLGDTYGLRAPLAPAEQPAPRETAMPQRPGRQAALATR